MNYLGFFYQLNASDLKVVIEKNILTRMNLLKIRNRGHDNGKT